MAEKKPFNNVVFDFFVDIRKEMFYHVTEKQLQLNGESTYEQI